MSLEKGIRHGKEKRKRYYNSGDVDSSCRPHGGCPYCEGNRLFSTKKAKLRANKEDQENEFYGYSMTPGPEDAMLDMSAEMDFDGDWSMQ